ncbi:MAG: DUF1330 domain-containing protein [Candidatus Thiodiazotropha sp. (ex Monitilora ramsayi)]|nr:DUF1330 domain-containing protein [Candidatus Thiodiazotropha sp. (ex Monitilora ramsayi)]
MSAYVIIRIKVTDAEKLKEYQKVVPSIIEQYEGRILARGSELVSLEGPQETRRVVMIEFPDLTREKDFYCSEVYTSAIALRENAAVFESIAIDGLS